MTSTHQTTANKNVTRMDEEIATQWAEKLQRETKSKVRGMRTSDKWFELIHADDHLSRNCNTEHELIGIWRALSYCRELSPRVNPAFWTRVLSAITPSSIDEPFRAGSPPKKACQPSVVMTLQRSSYVFGQVMHKYRQLLVFSNDRSMASDEYTRTLEQLESFIMDANALKGPIVVQVVSECPDNFLLLARVRGASEGVSDSPVRSTQRCRRQQHTDASFAIPVRRILGDGTRA